MAINIPSDLKYVSTHEWAREEGENIVTIGITDYAQDLLGDVVYVELPPLGTYIKPGDECGVVESVKAASDIYSPVAGEIIEINESLEESPDLVNEDPYGEGWIFRVRLSEPKSLDDLLTPTAYEKQISSEVH